MKYLIYAMILMFGLVASAFAADVKFKATWAAPTQDVLGRPASAKDYIVYACDQMIGSRFSTNSLAEPSLVGECPTGTLKTYTTVQPSCEATYNTNKESGTLYLRVLARREYQSGDQTILIESDLSEQASMSFTTYAPLMPPGKPVIENPRYIVPSP